MHDATKRLIEIRAYKLKPGEAAAFHDAVLNTVMPMLRGVMDVVAHGPSAHEIDTYYLVRAYADLADLEAQQAAFYGADAWRLGPRESIVSRIDSYLNTVLWLSPDAVEDMRRLNAP
ncbi:NIPSNAP family protein [Ideonella sp.]|uniref:NIPSNAP family protein n=1 Tax=Ideonella sp. TaxID=1929293 RepID=UPI0035B1212B